MPELPEVARFRELLLPLVSDEHKLQFDLKQEANAPKKWLSQEDCDDLSNHYFCTDVLRKGKQLALVLKKNKNNNPSSEQQQQHKYILLHMGMTGRICTPDRNCRLENVKDDGTVFPPKHTYLILKAGTYAAAFSDTHKFGSCQLSNDLSSFESLAPDALDTADPTVVQGIVSKLTNQRSGIKSLLLDQKRVVSGVGNWVADEVLYQCEMHPDQANLSTQQAQALFDKLQSILSTAVKCLNNEDDDDGRDYPDSWLFPHRWTKKRASKDCKGRNISFVTSAGRTSAIVASIQKLRKSAEKRKAKAKDDGEKQLKKNKANAEDEEEQENPQQQEQPKKKIAASSSPKMAANRHSSRRKSPRLAA